MAPPASPAWLEITAFDYHNQLRRSWREQCMTQLCNTFPGFTTWPLELQGKQLVQQLLHSDVRDSCTGALPEIPPTGDFVIEGEFIVQMDELYDITLTIRERYLQNSNPRRMLKLLLHDGVKSVVGLEEERIPELYAHTPAGAKLLLVGPVKASDGLLCLTPDNVRVLGGHVAVLEARRLKMVAYVTQPDTGHRGPQRTLEQFMADATRAAMGPGPGSASGAASQQQQLQAPVPGHQQQQQNGTYQPQQQQQQQQQQHAVAGHAAAPGPVARSPASLPARPPPPRTAQPSAPPFGTPAAYPVPPSGQSISFGSGHCLDAAHPSQPSMAQRAQHRPSGAAGDFSFAAPAAAVFNGYGAPAALPLAFPGAPQNAAPAASPAPAEFVEETQEDLAAPQAHAPFVQETPQEKEEEEVNWVSSGSDKEGGRDAEEGGEGGGGLEPWEQGQGGADYDGSGGLDGLGGFYNEEEGPWDGGGAAADDEEGMEAWEDDPEIPAAGAAAEGSGGAAAGARVDVGSEDPIADSQQLKKMQPALSFRAPESARKALRQALRQGRAPAKGFDGGGSAEMGQGGARGLGNGNGGAAVPDKGPAEEQRGGWKINADDGGAHSPAACGGGGPSSSSTALLVSGLLQTTPAKGGATGGSVPGKQRPADASDTRRTTTGSSGKRRRSTPPGDRFDSGEREPRRQRTPLAQRCLGADFAGALPPVGAAVDMAELMQEPPSLCKLRAGKPEAALPLPVPVPVPVEQHAEARRDSAAGRRSSSACGSRPTPKEQQQQALHHLLTAAQAPLLAAAPPVPLPARPPSPAALAEAADVAGVGGRCCGGGGGMAEATPAPGSVDGSEPSGFGQLLPPSLDDAAQNEQRVTPLAELQQTLEAAPPEAFPFTAHIQGKLAAMDKNATVVQHDTMHLVAKLVDGSAHKMSAALADALVLERLQCTSWEHFRERMKACPTIRGDISVFGNSLRGLSGVMELRVPAKGAMAQITRLPER